MRGGRGTNVCGAEHPLAPGAVLYRDARERRLLSPGVHLLRGWFKSSSCQVNREGDAFSVSSLLARRKFH